MLSKIQIPEDIRPYYVRLAEGLRHLIQSNEFKNKPFPSTRELANHLKINRHTAAAAMSELVQSGWLKVETRQGFSVSQDLPKPSRRASIKEISFRYVDKVDLPPFSPGGAPTIKYNFQSGLPDLRLFPIAEFKTYINQSLREASTDLLNYSHPSGWPPLIQALEKYLSEIRGVNHRKLVITNGSQEAIFLSLQLLIKPGDAVALEELSYPPVRAALGNLGAKILPIKMDENGLLPDDLEKLADKHKIRALFLTPTHQFPTSTSLLADRRLRVMEIANRNDIPIIEDDYDHEFHYSANPPPPLAAMDQRGLVIYLSTFSKVLFPSARIAFMACSEEFYQRFCHFRRVVSHQNDSILQDALGRWIVDGGLQKHLRKMRNEYEIRRDALDRFLKVRQEKGVKLSWQVPQGGMALWLNTHQDSKRLAERARKKGIFVSPEVDYSLKKEAGTHLRLGFANQSVDELKASVAALADILD